MSKPITNPTPGTNSEPIPIDIDRFFKMPSDDEIKKLKEKYEAEGSKLFVINLTTDKILIMRVVNRSVYMQYTQQQAASTIQDGYQFVINFFIVHPHLDKQLYDSLLPGEIETIVQTIMSKHGYAEPVVYEL